MVGADGPRMATGPILGNEDARALGVRVEILRWLVLVLVACIVAAQVAVSGTIGWVRLVVPQMARMLAGPDHRVMMPAALLVGTLYLLAIRHDFRAQALRS